jgi:hypothetical protein
MKNRATIDSAAKPTPAGDSSRFNSGEKSAGSAKAIKMAEPHQTAALSMPTNLRYPVTGLN